MSRPYMRVCEACAKRFTSKSNGRIYCYTCSPAQVHGVSRKDGKVSGTEQLSEHSHPHKEALEKAGPPDDVEKASSEIASAKHAELVGIPNQKPKYVKRTDSKVKAEGRPRKGWGQCKHVRPKSQRFANCPKERWSSTVPFCWEHVEFWAERKAEKRGLQVALEDEADQKPLFTEADFNVKTYAEARALLGKINLGVFQGDVLPGKAKALKDMVMGQIKSLDSELVAKKIAERSSDDDDLPLIPDDTTAEADKALAEEVGITTPEASEEKPVPVPEQEEDIQESDPQ